TPRLFGTSAHHVTSAALRVACSTSRTTSSAPAMEGTALGDTNDATSTSGTPAEANASANSARRAGATAASLWRPSRGPTSRMRIIATPGTLTQPQEPPAAVPRRGGSTPDLVQVK